MYPLIILDELNNSISILHGRKLRHSSSNFSKLSRYSQGFELHLTNPQTDFPELLQSLSPHFHHPFVFSLFLILLLPFSPSLLSDTRHILASACVLMALKVLNTVHAPRRDHRPFKALSNQLFAFWNNMPQFSTLGGGPQSCEEKGRCLVTNQRKGLKIWKGL